jgi:hypothetical protein
MYYLIGVRALVCCVARVAKWQGGQTMGRKK